MSTIGISTIQSDLVDEEPKRKGKGAVKITTRIPSAEELRQPRAVVSKIIKVDDDNSPLGITLANQRARLGK